MATPNSAPLAEATAAPPAARFVTLEVIYRDLLPLYFDPLPHRQTIRKLLRAAKIPSVKTSPAAARGGGAILYSRSRVESWLRGLVAERN